jgi:hypothetical protein
VSLLTISFAINGSYQGDISLPRTTQVSTRAVRGNATSVSKPLQGWKSLPGSSA